MPTDHRWEWTLPDGVKVAATVDADDRVETVFVGARLVSEAPRGTKPEGHVLDDPPGVVVRFQRGALICILRLDGDEIAPNVWPVRKRAERPKPRVVALPVRAIALVVASFVLCSGAWWAWTALQSSSGARSPSALAETHRAENGRFVTHHPSRFVARRAQVPAGASGVILSDAQRSESIVVLAYTGDVPSDPWLVYKKLHPEALVLLPRSGPTYEEVSRKDDKCFDEPAAAVTGRSTTARGEPATVWSCAFAHDGAAYLVMYALRANAPSDEAARLREIVDAVELTHLAEVPGEPR